MCLTSLFAFALLSWPSRAYAELYDVTDSVNQQLVCLTSKTKTTFGTSDIHVSPVANTLGASQTSLRLLDRSTSTDGDWSTSKGYNWATPSFSNGSVLYVVHALNEGTLVEGRSVKVIAAQTWTFKKYDSNNSYLNLVHGVSDNYRYFVAKSGFTNVTEVVANEEGVLVMPFDVGYLIVACTVTGQGSLSSTSYVDATRKGSTILLVDVPEETIREIVQDQTSELKSTEGSDTVVGDVTSIGEDIVEGADFVQQTASFVSGSFDAVLNAEPDAGVPFPGLTIMGHTILPAQTVSVTGYLGSTIEDNIKTGCTLVLFLAWIMGLRGFYHKIFLGETEVEVVDE